MPRRDVLGEGAITRLSGSSTLAVPVPSWILTSMPETEPSSTHQACSQSFWAMPIGPAQYPKTPPAPEHEHRPRATRGDGVFPCTQTGHAGGLIGEASIRRLDRSGIAEIRAIDP